ncbi:MAG: hybrid sensor histidine kinase/response regulator [Vampirovibrionales bacterium]|nr:hybrid sensor histidine kinase/response regulator [Vampirovibrionales bacterium]
MANALRVLLVEDNESDALLIHNQLRYDAQIELTRFHRIENAAELDQALQNEPWDIVLSDYNLPSFSGPDALALTKQHHPHLPFILVSGKIGEETAAAALKAGASDYLLKDRLSKLSRVVLREIDEAEQRRLLAQAQQDLAKAKEFAEQANRRKSQVLAFVAHEFKNPLHAIQLFTDILKSSSAQGALSDGHQQAIHSIERALHQLQGLVGDILDIAAIEAGKIRLAMQSVALNEVIEEALLIVGEQARRRSMTLHFSPLASLPRITADPQRLRQVFINLLSNAIKYSPEGGAVMISQDWDAPDGYVRTHFQDQGAGIDEAALKQLFQEFYRVYSTLHSQQEGVGLGLALSKTLVELHHGEILVKSEPDKGSTFSVLLPVCQPSPD